MNAFVIAYGRAGCKIAAEFDRQSNAVENTIAFDTAHQLLADIDRIDDEWKVEFGKNTFEQRGTRGDLEQAIPAAKQTTGVIKQTLDRIGTRDIDAFLVIGSLGGGTGGSGAPAASEYLAESHANTPLYGVGVLPAKHEHDIIRLNAARSIQSFTDSTDALFLFDNEHLDVSMPETNPDVPDDTNPDTVFKDVNRTIATCLDTVFTADEQHCPDRLDGATVETSTVIEALNTGGLATFTYVTDTLPRVERPGLSGWMWRAITSLRNRHAAKKQNQTTQDPGTDSTSDPATNDGDDEHNAEGDGGASRVSPHPVDLLPYATRNDAAMLPFDTTPDTRTMHLLIAPEKHVTVSDVIAASDWIRDNTEATSNIVKVRPRRSKTVAVLGVASGIGIPARVQEVLQDGEAIADQITSSSQEAKNVNVFDGEETVPSIL